MAIVLTVVGILIAVTTPALSNFLQSNRIVGAMNDLMADIYYTRSLAVSKRQTHTIEFDATEYRIVETATATVLRTRTMPAGFTLASTDDPNFYAWGLADAADITITHGGYSRNVGLLANGNVSHD